MMDGYDKYEIEDQIERDNIKNKRRNWLIKLIRNIIKGVGCQTQLDIKENGNKKKSKAGGCGSWSSAKTSKTIVMERNKLIELIAIVTAIIFAVAMSFYHLFSTESTFLTREGWTLVWAIVENGLPISLCVIISLLTIGSVRFIFRWLFPTYFLVRFIYHLSCYLQIFVVSDKVWNWIWSIEMFALIAISFIICKAYIKTK
jgi:hypothetical protein